MTEKTPNPPGVPVPNYTQIPNVIFDELLPLMQEAELKVVLQVARKTFGYHKDRDNLSLSQLEKLTGLSRQGVINGITAAHDHGIMGREKSGNSFTYFILVNEVDRSTLLTTFGQPNRPKKVNEVDTQKKGRKKKKESPDTPALTPDGWEIPEGHTIASHPAIQAFRDATHRYPPKSWYEKVCTAVTFNPEQVARWSQVCMEWVGHGYNPQNVTGMMEQYQSLNMPPKTKTAATPLPDRTPMTEEERAEALKKMQEARRGNKEQ